VAIIRRSGCRKEKESGQGRCKAKAFIGRRNKRHSGGTTTRKVKLERLKKTNVRDRSAGPTKVRARKKNGRVRWPGKRTGLGEKVVEETGCENEKRDWVPPKRGWETERNISSGVSPQGGTPAGRG